MMLLLAACVDPHVDKDADVDVDTGIPDSGEVDTAELDSADTGEYEVVPLVEGFEHGLLQWKLQFSVKWGESWGILATNDEENVLFVAGQINNPHWEANTSYAVDLSYEMTFESSSASVYQGPDVGCNVDKCGDCGLGAYTYRSASGRLEASVWEHSVDVRISDLVLRPQPEGSGDDLVVPLIERTGVPIGVCPRASCD